MKKTLIAFALALSCLFPSFSAHAIAVVAAHPVVVARPAPVVTARPAVVAPKAAPVVEAPKPAPVIVPPVITSGARKCDKEKDCR